MPVHKEFESVYAHQWNINFTQCAPNLRLKYVDLCNLLQLTAAEHSILGGLSFNDMQQYNQAWVLSRIRIEIDQLPQWQDNVTVKTWIESLEGANSLRNIEMYQDNVKLAGASTYWTVLNTQERKAEALRLPHDHFKKYNGWHATQKPVSRINFLKDTTTVAERVVQLSDLDIVNHANNVKYLEWCLDCIDPKVVLEKEIKVIEMNFLRELNWGDTVQINISTADSATFFSIAKAGKICFALEIEWK